VFYYFAGAIIGVILVLAIADWGGVADVGWPWEEGTKTQGWTRAVKDAADALMDDARAALEDEATSGVPRLLVSFPPRNVSQPQRGSHRAQRRQCRRRSPGRTHPTERRDQAPTVSRTWG
jgi:hypothetical protein